MPHAVVAPEEVSDLSRRLAEVYAEARGMRVRLEEAEGPLAMLAGLRVQAIEDNLGTCLESLDGLAEILVSVTVD